MARIGLRLFGAEARSRPMRVTMESGHIRTLRFCSRGSTMHSQRRALLLNSVVALFILEGLYYLYRILVTLLTDQQLVLDARLVCIPIAVGLLSRKKAWGGIALVYVALAVIGTL